MTVDIWNLIFAAGVTTIIAYAVGKHFAVCACKEDDIHKREMLRVDLLCYRNAAWKNHGCYPNDAAMSYYFLGKTDMVETIMRHHEFTVPPRDEATKRRDQKCENIY